MLDLAEQDKTEKMSETAASETTTSEATETTTSETSEPESSIPGEEPETTPETESESEPETILVAESETMQESEMVSQPAAVKPVRKMTSPASKAAGRPVSFELNHVTAYKKLADGSMEQITSDTYESGNFVIYLKPEEGYEISEVTLTSDTGRQAELQWLASQDVKSATGEIYHYYWKINYNVPSGESLTLKADAVGIPIMEYFKVTPESSSTYGETVTFEAKITAAGEPMPDIDVKFGRGYTSQTVQTDGNGIAKLEVSNILAADYNDDISGGYKSLRASYYYDYEWSNPIKIPYQVKKADYMMSFEPVQEPIYYGDVFEITALGEPEVSMTYVKVDSGDMDVLLRQSYGSGSIECTGTFKAVGVGDGIIISTKDGNDNYNEGTGTLTVTVHAKPLTITNIAIKDKQYDGTVTAEFKSEPVLKGVINGDDVTLTYDPVFDAPNAGEDISVTANFALTGKDADKYTLTQPEDLTATIYNNYDGKGDYTVESIFNENGWTAEDFTVTAKEGFLLSATNTAEGTWTATLTASDETADGMLTFYVKNINTGAISKPITEKYKIDKTAPVIAGIENGKTYCISAAFTVTEVNLDSVTVNGKTVTAAEGSYALQAGENTVKVTDFAGNTAVMTVTVNAEHTPEADDKNCETATNCTVCNEELKAALSHDFEGEWSSDTQNHWHLCVNDGCEVTDTKQTHTPNEDDGDCTSEIRCSVCKAVTTKALEHDFTGDPIENEAGHWNACANPGCKVTSEILSHVPEADDGDCTTPIKCKDCGRILTGAKEHKFSSSWTSDGKEHWYSCSNAGCTVKNEKAAHTPEKDDGSCATAVHCSVCRAVTTAARSHDFSGAWSRNERGHWSVCRNGSCRVSTSLTAHTLKTYESNGSVYKACTVCGYRTGEVFNGILEGADGEFYYYKDNKVDTEFCGIVDYNGGKFYVEDGRISRISGLHLIDGKWYYFALGQVQTQHTGLVQYDGEWFYVTKGIMDKAVSGLVEYDGGLFIVAVGRLCREADGLWQNPKDGKWYFAANGQIQTQHTGVAMYDGEWFYIRNGELASDFNGTVEYDGAIFRVVAGQLYGQVK